MLGMKRYVPVLLLLLACCAPAQAAPLHSDNVSLVTKLPEAVGAASARFSPDGKTMYVSTWKGLLTYDVSKPADPQRLGFLPLPHFENEDVDAGDGVVIITNDPSEGKGLIYVIDVRNPALPSVRSVIDNGDALGSGAQSNTGHIANCIQGCKYLWTTGTEEGIAIWDLSDLSSPKFVKLVGLPGSGFTHDVFVDRTGIAWVTGEDGTFGYTTADPTNPQLLYRSDEAVTNSGNSGPSSPETAQDYPLDFLHHNSIRTDIQLAPTPLPPVATPPAGRPPSRAALRRALKRCGKRRRCRARARRAYRRKVAAYNRIHPRTTLGGTGDVMAITEEDYLRPGCQGEGSLETWQIVPGEHNADGTIKLVLLDTWKTELNELSDFTGRSPATVMCSAHWFDEDRGLLAQGWYDQGVRFLDINDPRHIRQVGYWVTSGMFWAAYYAPTDPTRQTVYALDVLGGIDVLHIDRSSMATRRAPIPRRWMSGVSFTGARPSPTFGFACPQLLGTMRGVVDGPAA